MVFPWGKKALHDFAMCPEGDSEIHSLFPKQGGSPHSKKELGLEAPELENASSFGKLTLL